MVAKGWRSFLADAELAKNHSGVAREASIRGAVPVWNPLLDSLLPSLLYIRLASFIDYALGEYISSQGWAIPKPLCENFKGRISFLADKGVLLSPNDLHDLRLKRNTLSHQPASSCSWIELENAVQMGQQELENVKLVGPRPKFEFFSNKLTRELDQGQVWRVDYEYGLMEGADIELRVEWGRSTGDPSEAE